MASSISEETKKVMIDQHLKKELTAIAVRDVEERMFSQEIKDAKDHCVCGSVMNEHGDHVGHTPMSQYDKAIDDRLTELFLKTGGPTHELEVHREHSNEPALRLEGDKQGGERDAASADGGDATGGSEGGAEAIQQEACVPKVRRISETGEA